MSDKCNKAQLSPSPKSSPISSPNRSYARVVSPKVTPKRKIAKVSDASKRKRVGGSSNGLSKFRKLTSVKSTIHRQQFEVCNNLEPNEKPVKSVHLSKTKVMKPAEPRTDSSYRPIKIQSSNDKIYTDMYQSFEKQNYDNFVESQKIIKSLTGSLNSVFTICSNAINETTELRGSSKKSNAPNLGSMHDLCVKYKSESEIQAKKSSILADAMFLNLSEVSKTFSDNPSISKFRPNSSSVSGNARKVRFSEIKHFEPVSSGNYLEYKSSVKTTTVLKHVHSKPTKNVASSNSSSKIEIVIPANAENRTSLVDSAKKAEEKAKISENIKKFRNSSPNSKDLSNFDISNDEVVDSSEPTFTNSQLTSEAYEEFVNSLVQSSLKDPKKYFNKKPFNGK